MFITSSPSSSPIRSPRSNNNTERSLPKIEVSKKSPLFQFSEDLEVSNPTNEKSIKSTLKKDFDSSLEINLARENISNCIKNFEDGSKNNIFKYFKDIYKACSKNTNSLENKLFIYFKKMAEAKTELDPEISLNTSSLSIPTQSENEKFIKINTYFKNYSLCIMHPEGKNLKKETLKLFDQLIKLVPHENQIRGKEILNELIEQGSEFINRIGVDQKQNSHLNYFKSCENFINLIFENNDENLTPIKQTTLMCFSFAGLFLTYVHRSKTSKLFIWLKRAFVPIGYILHELAGVALQSYIDPLYAAALGSSGAFALTFVLTLIVGLIVVKSFGYMIDLGLEKGHKNIQLAIVNSLTILREDLGLAPKEEIVFNENFIKLPKKEKDIIENKQNIERYFENTDENKIPKWFIPNELPPSKWKNINKTELKIYFNLLKNYCTGDDVNTLFYLQHQYINNSDEENNEKMEENRRELEKIYEKIAKNILDNNENWLNLENERPQINSLKYKKYLQYLILRIEKYSQLLITNSRSFGNSFAHNSTNAAFITFDVIADVSGMIITKICEPYNISINTVGIAASIFGLIPTGLGIYSTMKLQAWASVKDEIGIQIPNDFIKNEVCDYLEAELSTIEQNLTRLEEDRISFSSAEMFNLNFRKKEIEKVLQNIEKASFLEKQEEIDEEKEYIPKITPQYDKSLNYIPPKHRPVFV